jgi:hypothetical protein
MAVSQGSIVQASEYNSIADLVNKIFGDNYSSAAVTDVDKTNHKFGWGAANLNTAIPAGTLIQADKLQFLVDRTNVMIDHANITDSVLVFASPAGRTTVSANTLVRAEDINLIENKINNTLLVNNVHMTVDADSSTYMTSTPLNGPYERNVIWQNRITGEHKWSFNDYSHARHFFNSGGQLRLSASLENGTTTGFFNWADVINEMGVLSFNWTTVFQSSSGRYTTGTSEGKGFYDLTEYYGDGSDAGAPDEGLLFTSAGVTTSAYGYGYGYGYGYDVPVTPPSGYGYGPYSSMNLRLYGKYANNGSEVHFKIVLDDTAFAQTIDGTLSVTLSYLMPDTIIEGSATFDVTPDPVSTILDDFNTGDDS